VRRTPAKPYTEAQAIAALKRVAKRWPDTLWLFSASGTLTVMRKPAGGCHAMDQEGSMDHDYIVDTIPGIDNDGGDW
jgi:hypothetical protein